jgi:hypothetical protein
VRWVVVLAICCISRRGDLERREEERTNRAVSFAAVLRGRLGALRVCCLADDDITLLLAPVPRLKTQTCRRRTGQLCMMIDAREAMM